MYHICVVEYVSYFRAVSAQGFEYDDLYVTAHLELSECKCSNAHLSLSG